MKLILSFVVLVVVCTTIIAQPAHLSEKKPKTDAMLFGDVKSNKEHIPFATILVKGTTIGTAADATGHFKMTNLPVGKQTIDYFNINESKPFFDTGIKLSYDFKMTDHIKIQLNGGIKNILNSFQDDFDSGIDRDPAYVYGPLAPRTIYFGLRIGNL